MPISGNRLRSHPDLTPAAATNLVRAERIASSLQGRTIGRADILAGPTWRAVYLERGGAEVVSQGRGLDVAAPCIAWLPWTPDCRLRIAPGSAGIHVLAGNASVTNAVGYKAESADLWLVARQQVYVPLAPDGAAARTVSQCVEGILTEFEEGSASSSTAIEAYLRILLIHLWREQGAPGALGSAASPSQRYLMRFNSLVEARFKERWSVAAYADAIGVSADRLNDICRRFRDKTPKQILDDRIETEARLLLENSTHSIEQIAGLLGFPSAANFSRFFRKLSGLPPGRYRREFRNAAQRSLQTNQAALYDWP